MGSSTAQYGLTGRWVRSRAITKADTGTTVPVLDVPANTLIPPFGVVIEVVTLFAGGSPSLDIGDTDDSDGWIDTTEITEATVGTYGGHTNAYALNGKVYTAADTIDAVMAASATAGKAYVYAFMIDVSDVRDD
jgi:hypothetical protein